MAVGFIETLNRQLSSELPIQMQNSLHTPLDDKMIAIRDRVFQIIQVAMPIEILFNPDLKINLAQFVKDQFLIHRISQLIEPSIKDESIDLEKLEELFKETSIKAEIEQLFKSNHPAYLRLVYEACLDVLRNRSFDPCLESALNSRIFTLKNAILAIANPEKIAKNLTKQDISQEAAILIKKNGFNFIREMIHTHLKTLQKALPSFQETLLKNAHQLLPFVQRVTITYLRENNQECPEDFWAWRNRKGLNFHALIATPFMGFCLNALNYNTESLFRWDLEPKAFITESHSILKVTDSDSNSYVVDPTYRQFHGEVALTAQDLPEESILVLSVEKIREYVEQTIMPKWERNLRLVADGDQETINLLIENNQILPLTIHCHEIIPELNVTNLIEWIINAFSEIWDTSRYEPTLTNPCLQQIFYQSPIVQRYLSEKTHALVRPLNIPHLTDHRSYQEVENILNGYLHDPTLKERDFQKILLLVSFLPNRSRSKYASLLNIDITNRFADVDIITHAYLRFLNKIVNPDNKDLSVIYPCSGPLVSAPFIATNTRRLLCVDLTPLVLSDFRDILAKCRKTNMSKQAVFKDLENSDNFYLTHRIYLGVVSHYLSSNGHQYTKDFALKLFFDLTMMGVDLNRVIISGRNGEIEMSFPWSYNEGEKVKSRTILFVTSDITKPTQYPEILKTFLKSKFDIFFSKASVFVPNHYSEFLPHLASHMNGKGWFMTSDVNCNMDIITPEECLKANQINVNLYQSDLMDLFHSVIYPPFDPLKETLTPPKVELKERVQRIKKSSVLYWLKLTLRQKA